MKRPHIPLPAMLSLLAGFAACVLIILTCAPRPLQALSTLFTGTFSNAYYFGTMLSTATFLMTAGCGAAIALQGGNMNLGGEGQVYLGGYLSALLLGAGWGGMPSPLVFCLTVCAVLAAGALMAAVSAALKELRGAEVLLTSFLLSSAVQPLIDGLITASKRTSAQNLLALPPIGTQFRFAQLLPPSAFTAAFFVAAALCAGTWLFLGKTFAGRTVRIWGTAPRFARYSGYSSAACSFGSLAVSGALHALTGLLAVCGTYYTCHKDFYSGMGWNALSCALIVSSRPLALIPASLVLAWLYTSADRVGLTQGFSFDISGIVQGCILFAIAIPFSVQKITARTKEAAA